MFFPLLELSRLYNLLLRAIHGKDEEKMIVLPRAWLTGDRVPGDISAGEPGRKKIKSLLLIYITFDLQIVPFNATDTVCSVWKYNEYHLCFLLMYDFRLSKLSFFLDKQWHVHY